MELYEIKTRYICLKMVAVLRKGDWPKDLEGNLTSQVYWLWTRCFPWCGTETGQTQAPTELWERGGIKQKLTNVHTKSDMIHPNQTWEAASCWSSS